VLYLCFYEKRLHVQFCWSIRMLPKANFHCVRGNKERAIIGALRNGGYETAGDCTRRGNTFRDLLLLAIGL
jgi:hypothetical protein